MKRESKGGPVAGGYVYGITRPLHLGNTTQIWEMRISGEEEKIVCISRLTLAVLEKKPTG